MSETTKEFAACGCVDIVSPTGWSRLLCAEHKRAEDERRRVEVAGIEGGDKLIRLVPTASHDRAEMIALLEKALEYVRQTEDAAGPWAIVIGTNCAGDARVTYTGNAHEVLALASRLTHSINREIDEP